MFDTDRGKPVQVVTDELAGSYLQVSVKHLEQVRALLSDNQIGHWVEHYAISVDGGPAVVVIHLSKKSDPRQVQALLDQAT